MTDNKSFNPLTLVLGLSAAFFLVFLIISGLFYFSKGSEEMHSGSGSTSSFFSSAGLVGVLEINGIIMDSKKTLNRLERLEENNRIKAVVLRLNTPGGAVAPSQEIYEAVKSFKKPLVVSMGSVAASGGYYIASGAKKVYANPGSMTGSIGVIMEFMNLEKLYGWAKVDRYSVKSGKFKDIGAEYRQMTPDEKALLQAMVNDILNQFRSAVAEGRGLKPERVVTLSDGRIFSGRQAKAEGLVDELGTIRDAINEAGKLGGIKGKPKVYYVEKPKNLIEKLFDDSSVESQDSPGGLFGLAKSVALSAMSLLAQMEQPSLLDASTVVAGPYLLWRGAKE